MKSKITFSKFSTILTAVVCVGLFAGCILTVNDGNKFFTLLVLYLILLITALFMGPLYIKADSENIVLGSILRSKKLPMSEVKSVELFPPTMGAIRVFASGGFMGYWGVFREGGIGKYYAFYGKASDCFLVKMKSGYNYLLGCDDRNKMVDYIKSQIGK